MTLKQFMRLADELADKHGLSSQLTVGWLRERGIDKKPFSSVTLTPKAVQELCAFARI